MRKIHVLTACVALGVLGSGCSSGGTDGAQDAPTASDAPTTSEVAESGPDLGPFCAQAAVLSDSFAAVDAEEWGRGFPYESGGVSTLLETAQSTGDPDLIEKAELLEAANDEYGILVARDHLTNLEMYCASQE